MPPKTAVLELCDLIFGHDGDWSASEHGQVVVGSWSSPWVGTVTAAKSSNRLVAVRHKFTLCGTNPKNVIVKYNFSEKHDMASHRLDHFLFVDFSVQTLAAADGCWFERDKEIAQLLVVR